MISWREPNFQATETLDEDVLGISNQHTVCRLYDGLHINDNVRHSRICMICEENENLVNDVICSNEMKQTSLSFQHQDYVEKIQEFHFYVDKVKKILKPGCSVEMLNVALNSVSSLVKELSLISSKQSLHASL